MRYLPQYKEEKRERVVRAASRHFRLGVVRVAAQQLRSLTYRGSRLHSAKLRKSRRAMCVYSCLSVCLGTLLVFGSDQIDARVNEWSSYGGDPGGTRYSGLNQINRTNVVNLK